MRINRKEIKLGDILKWRNPHFSRDAEVILLVLGESKREAPSRYLGDVERWTCYVLDKKNTGDTAGTIEDFYFNTNCTIEKLA